jgi:hypothetical protein
MLDRLYLPLLGLVAAAAITLAMVWPQGLGDRSPAPFGHMPLQRTPQMQAAMKREADAANQRTERARQTMRDLQTEALSPSQ